MLYLIYIYTNMYLYTNIYIFEYKIRKVINIIK